GGGSAGQLSRQDYLNKGDAICRDLAKRARALPQPTSITSYRDAVRTSVTINEDGLVQFQKLKPPRELQADHETIVRVFGQAIARQRRLIFAKTSPAIVSLNAQLQKTNAKLNAVAMRDGFKVCNTT
ncbi:MAG TPA: hypothetical protein VIM22_05120, partial [Solirubrobacteraceae bacterium]